MAIRVRKLARQLGRTPDDLLQLLQALGLSRYDKPDHMLPAHAADALKQAVNALPAPRGAAARPRPRPPQEAPRAASAMQALVPGVQPIEGPQTVTPSGPAETVPSTPPVRSAAAPTAPAAPTGPSAAQLGVEREALATLRRELESQRAEVEAERQALRAQTEELTEAHAAVRQERARLRKALNDAHQTHETQEGRDEDRTFLAYMLHRRGLRGMDECERALAALAERRQLRPVIELLRCDRPDRVMDVLQQRLVLVGGAVPAGLPDTLAAVSVAPDRADVPGEHDLSRGLARFSEILMLHGLRRVTVVGGRPAWHKTLREGLDARVALRFIASAADLGGASALHGNELHILWGQDDTVPGALERHGGVVVVRGDHLLSLLTGVEEFLRDSAA